MADTPDPQPPHSIDAADLAPADLRARAEALRADGWRPATVTCVRCADDGAELLYHFQRGLEMSHWRVRLGAGQAAASLTPLFPCLFLAENEVQDLFGLPFDGLAPDLKGRLYMHGGRPPLRSAPQESTPDKSAPDQTGGPA